MISAVQFDRSFFKTIHQLFEGSLITPSTLPVDELTGITTVGFPDPKFVFFEFKKSCVRQVLQFSASSRANQCQFFRQLILCFLEMKGKSIRQHLYFVFFKKESPATC